MLFINAIPSAFWFHESHKPDLAFLTTFMYLRHNDKKTPTVWLAICYFQKLIKLIAMIKDTQRMNAKHVVE